MDQPMSFSEALNGIKAGLRMTRRGWNGKGMFILLMSTDTAAVLQPFIAFKPVSGSLVPWVASQTDLLAMDWEEA